MNDFMLEFWLGKELIQSTTLQLGMRVEIGSQDACSVVLIGDRIAPIHAEVCYLGNRVNISAIDGEVRIAGNVIESSELSEEGFALIGPYVVRLNQVKRVSQHEVQSNVVSKIPSQFAEIMAQLPNIYQLKRPSLLISISVLFIALIFVIFSGSSSDDEFISSKRKDAVNEQQITINISSEDRLEIEREILRYHQWGEELIKQGKFDESIILLNVATGKFPDSVELADLHLQAALERVNVFLQDKGYAESLALLETFATKSEVARQKITEINKMQQKEVEYEAKKEKLQAEFEVLSKSAQEKMLLGEWNEAENLLHDSNLANLPEDASLSVAFQSLLKKVQGEIAENKRKVALQKQEKLIERKQSKVLFYECLRNQYHELLVAYHACNDALGLNVGTVPTKELEIWMEYLNRIKNQSMVEWSKQAEDCYLREDIRCALDLWQNMVDVGNESIKNRIEKVIVEQRAKADDLYKKARAYKELGRPMEVRRTIKSLKKLLPIEEEIIYIKANNLLDGY